MAGGYAPPAEFNRIVILMVVAAVVANALLIGILYWRLRPKLLKKLEVFPTDLRQIVGARIVKSGDQERIDVASGTFS